MEEDEIQKKGATSLGDDSLLTLEQYNLIMFKCC
jgi:hypothetical protein